MIKKSSCPSYQQSPDHDVISVSALSNGASFDANLLHRQNQNLREMPLSRMSFAGDGFTETPKKNVLQASPIKKHEHPVISTSKKHCRKPSQLNSLFKDSPCPYGDQGVNKLLASE
jgi:hypothetical protein